MEMFEKNYWIKPRDSHIVYEALSAIADGRFELTGENTAKCTSTSQGKFYEIELDPKTNSIMSNDNMAFYVGELSYPMVAMLLVKNVIPYDETIQQYLKDIKWKNINQKNKNDYMKSVEFVLNLLKEQGVDTEKIRNECDRIYGVVVEMKLSLLGTKKVPPKAY